MKSLIQVAALILALAPSAFAAAPKKPARNVIEQDMQGLKREAARKFLIEANDPKSVVGRAIAAINRSTADGRNQDGTIVLPVKAADIRVVTVNTEDIYNPWHYASLKGRTCTSTDKESLIMIMLNQQTGVHMAQETDSALFTVSGREKLEMKILKSGLDYCDQVDEPASSFSSTKTSFEIDEFKSATLN